jgi:hypothetical protein
MVIEFMFFIRIGRSSSLAELMALSLTPTRRPAFWANVALRRDNRVMENIFLLVGKMGEDYLEVGGGKRFSVYCSLRIGDSINST